MKHNFMSTSVNLSFSGDSAINYHSDWNWNPSGSTRSTVFNKPTNTSENYKLSSLYPIMNTVISYILHLPKDFITHLIQISFGKKTISDIVTSQESDMLDINPLSILLYTLRWRYNVCS